MLWLALASAHPLNGVMPSHDVVVEMGPERVQVTFAARIPTHDVLQDVGDRDDFTPEAAEAYNVARLRELRDALVLRVDGQRVNWEEPTPSDESGTGNSRFVLYEQTLSAPMGTGEWAFSNGNTPDQLSYFRWSVGVAQAWTVADCSLWRKVEDGAVRLSDNAVWSLDEADREVRWVVHAVGPWQQHLLPPEPRSIDLALAPGVPWTWGVGGGAVVVAGVAGAAAAARRRRRSRPA